MNQEITELFEKLNLTEYEAKCLNIVNDLNEAKAPEISRLAQVPKTRVYDVLEKLCEKELLISIQERPKKYKSIGLEKTLEKLLEKRKNEIIELEKHANKLKNKFKNKKLSETTEKIIKVKTVSDFIKILAQEIETAKNSVDGFTEITLSQPIIRKSLNEALKRKVKVRLISDVEPREEKLKGVEIKNQTHGLEAFIIDEKKLILAINDLKKEMPEYHFTLMNKKPIITALKNHFNENWGKLK